MRVLGHRDVAGELVRVADLLAEDHAGLLGEETPKARRTAPTTGDRIYQFKVTLLDIKPAIWRRVRVPDCTLAELHEYIQAALGWENYHLHQFDIDGERYGPAAPDDMDFGLEMRDEAGVTLTIDDDGRGLGHGEQASPGLGLTSMRERAALMGGTLTVRRGPLGGTRVSVHVPVPLAGSA